MKRTRHLVVVALLVLAPASVAACGGGDSKPSAQGCIDKTIDILKKADPTQDGYQEKLASDIEAFSSDCNQFSDEFESYFNAHSDEILSEIDPAVVSDIGNQASSSFSSVGSAVN